MVIDNDPLSTLYELRSRMNTANEKIIELSKIKVLLLIIGSCAFVAIGLWMLQMDSAEIEAQRRFNSPLFVYGLGTLSIVFFGLCGAFGIKKLFDRKPGLVLSSAGILDNSSGVSAGLIPWSEITGFSVLQVQKQKILIVGVADPEKYIEIGGSLKRVLNRANLKMCGSPIAITSNSLKIGFDELLDSCNQYLAAHGKRPNS
jgi:hypothetical protein